MTTPGPKSGGLTPLDPFLGRRQDWTKERQTLADQVPIAPLSDDLIDHITSLENTHSLTRPFVLHEDVPFYSAGAQVVRIADNHPDWALSWTSVPRQHRFRRLPLLIRKTVLELRPQIQSKLPVPDRLSDSFDWLRATLLMSDRPVVIVWEGMDFVYDLHSAGSWFGFSSPWPAHVRWVVTIPRSPQGKDVAERLTRFGLPSLAPEPVEPPPTRSLSADAQVVAGTLLLSDDGRSENELRAILSDIDPTSLNDALQELQPYLVKHSDGRLSIVPDFAREYDEAIAERIDRATMSFLRERWRTDRWAEAEYVRLLVHHGDAGDEATEHLSNSSFVWQLWNRERDYLYDIAYRLETPNPERSHWQNLTQLVLDRPSTESHHLIPYADVLDYLDYPQKAEEIFALAADRCHEQGATYYEQVARRRAAETSFKRGEYALALSQQIPDTSDLRRAGPLALMKADALIEQNRLGEAEEVLLSLERKCFEAGAQWCQIDALARLADIARKQKNEAALANIDAQILLLGRTSPTGPTFLHSLGREAERKLEAKDFATLEQLAPELHEAAVLLGEPAHVGQALGMLALLADRKGNAPSAETMLAAKERLCRQVGDLDGVANAMITRAGVLALRLHQPDEARLLLATGLDLAKRLANDELIARGDELQRILPPAAN